jgi:hypothetical protein
MGLLLIVSIVVNIFLLWVIGNMENESLGTASTLRLEIKKLEQEAVVLKREIALLQNQDRLEDGV